MTIAAALCLFLPHSSFPGEPGADFMLDLWKYRTGEADTGLLTGRPSRKIPDAPPGVFASVSGSIVCRQHLVLRPNDIIDVVLLDFAARDAAAVITNQKITSPGQIPIPFKLAYEPAKINPAHHYTVQARIMRNGEPAFINSAPCFVITHGYSNTVRVIVEKTNTTQPSRAEKGLLLPQPGSLYIGTYTRSYHGAGGTVTETLRVLNDHSMELYSKYLQGDIKQTGVWSMENNLLAVTVTSKDGEQVNPNRIVFELQDDRLVAIEYDRAVYGSHYTFNCVNDRDKH